MSAPAHNDSAWDGNALPDTGPLSSKRLSQPPACTSRTHAITESLGGAHHDDSAITGIVLEIGCCAQPAPPRQILRHDLPAQAVFKLGGYEPALGISTATGGKLIFIVIGPGGVQSWAFAEPEKNTGATSAARQDFNEIFIGVSSL